jgi:hypothetical protein
MASGLHNRLNMRNALLVALLPVLALTTVSVVGCGDASSSTGIQRSRGGSAIPAPGSNEEHDPSLPDEPSDDPNPNASTPPPAPTTTGTAAAGLEVALSTATPATDLGTKTDVTVTVTPKTGFTGAVTLTATGLPAGATATFNPASVTLGAAPMTSVMSLTVPATATPSAAGAASAIVVKAASGATEATANANFKVNPKITMTIPVNADALRAAVGVKYVDGWFGPTFGTAPAPLTTQAGNPIAVVVKNADSVAHIVHGNAGFVHGDTGNPVPAGGTDPKTRTLAAGVNTSGYLHEGANGTSVSFRITVNTAP